MIMIQRNCRITETKREKKKKKKSAHNVTEPLYYFYSNICFTIEYNRDVYFRII